VGEPIVATEDSLAAWLGCFSIVQRAVAVPRVLRDPALRIEPVTLLPRAMPFEGRWSARTLLRSLDAAQCERLTERLKAVPGFGNLGTVFIASAFRVIQHMTPQSLTPDSLFQSPVAFEIHSRGQRGVRFHNFASRIVFRARLDELADRDQLLRTLAAQFRAQVDDRVILQNLQGVQLLDQVKRFLPRFRLPRFGRQHSIQVAYFDALLPKVTTFLGAPLERVFLGSTCMAPPGVSLHVVKSGSGLLILLTHVPEAISESTAVEFLDRVLADLLT
jgi:hypothetical protein